ncbi:MAG: hypothetical protein JSW41_02715 [Candidatus Aenigmatarchaeota archaeon]|nr:MAG: hypothetical protein JSW41_02715 [Candidatus Aenigmarchaeota archaeon]
MSNTDEQTLKVDDLPSMDDYEEGSSLIIDDGEKPPVVDPPEETDEEREAREAEEQQAREEAEEKQRLADEEKAAAAEEEKKKAAEEESKKQKASGKSKGKEKSEEPEETGSESDDFFKEVQGITGIELEVDYGDSDPLTPEGIAKRDQALASAAIDSQMQYLEENFPRAYRVLQHEANGGNVEDLFKANYVDYSKIELKEDDADQHKRILQEHYMEKGMSESRAKRNIEMDEDSEGGTYQAAKEVLAEKVKKQKDDEDKVLKDQEAAAKQQQEYDNQMRKIVEDVATSGKVGNFQIPKADQKEFYNYALSNISRNPQGGYSFVIPLNSETLDGVLQQAFFAYKGGDLSKLVETKATTKNAQKLRLNVKSTKKDTKTSEATEDPLKDEKKKKLSGFEDYTVES